MRKLRTSRGFTLVEIMIVVLIIGILLAIAVPNFIKARESSRVRTCVANLKQIEAAKEQWAMENKKTSTDTPVQADLEGTNGYIKKWPSCPSGGTYTINDVATAPACSLAAQGHTLYVSPFRRTHGVDGIPSTPFSVGAAGIPAPCNASFVCFWRG